MKSAGVMAVLFCVLCFAGCGEKRRERDIKTAASHFVVSTTGRYRCSFTVTTDIVYYTLTPGRRKP